MVRVTGHGRAAELPRGWEGRVYRRPPAEADATSHPVLHVATFPLPEARGDFGSDATDLMGPDDAFVALVEYDPEAAGTALFAAQGPPWPLPARAFSPRQLQRHVPGQSGAQFFFSSGGRAFCLYVVLGDHTNRLAVLGPVNRVLASVELPAADGAGGGQADGR